MKNTIILILSAIFLFSCKYEAETKTDSSSTNKILKIVCTTSMIGDAINNIASDSMSVTTLMGAGVDPHLYSPKPSDLKALNEADIIIYNGLHLEGKMIETFDELAKTKHVLLFSDGVNESDIIHSDAFEASVDPHFWFDTDMWRKSIGYVSDELIKIQPNCKEQIDSKTKNYLINLVETNAFIVQMIEEIPEEKRILVTSHDAFSYFGRKFGVEVKGLQGISTLSESGIKEVNDMIDFIIEKKLPAIFVESSVSQKTLKSVQEGCLSKGFEVKIGGELYSDALGAKGTPEGTYEGMLRANVITFHNALTK